MLHDVQVLAVDDDDRNLRMLTAALTPAGCTVRTASSGEEALAAVRWDAPDVILLDVLMPGMGGLRACRVLKSDESTRLIPVLLVTGLDSREDRVRGIEAGCDDFVSKPFDLVELRARVRTMARLSYAGLRQREEELLACAIEDAPDGLVVAGEDGEILHANDSARAMLGFGDGQPPAGVWEAVTRRFRLSPRPTWDDLLDADHTVLTAVAREGTRRWTQLTVRRVQPRRASIAARCVLTLHDITAEVSDTPPVTPVDELTARRVRASASHTVAALQKLRAMVEGDTGAGTAAERARLLDRALECATDTVRRAGLVSEGAEAARPRARRGPRRLPA